MKVITTKESKLKQKSGIDKVADLVKITLGPKGRNVAIDVGFGTPIVTNDGVTIARHVEVEDETEQIGAQLIKDVANQTNHNAGDGTTTSVVLAQALIDEGMDRLENPMIMRESLEEAKDKAVSELKRLAQPVSDQKEVENIASISAESREIGKIIADTFEHIGKDGVITVQESFSTGIEREIVNGYRVEAGLPSPFMATRPDGTAEHHNPAVLVYGGTLSTIKDLAIFLDMSIKSGVREMVLFAEDFEPMVLEFLVTNTVMGKFKSAAVKVKYEKNEVMEDIALVTGASIIPAGQGMDKQDIKVLGKAEKVILDGEKSVIIGGHGDTNEKVEALRELLKGDKKESVEQRIAKLTGGVAVIKVGAKTESERKYLKDKIEDAVHATRSAIEEGIVEGGGMTLWRIAEHLDGDNVGETILRKALRKPLRQIVENAGKDIEAVTSKIGELGYDAKSDTFVDLIKNGIIDPAKVERNAIENACSFAGVFLTMGASIAIKKEIKQ